MNYLVQGGESKERLALLVKSTKLRSEPLIAALIDYLVIGHTIDFAVMLNGVDRSNFNRALTRLNEQATIIEQIKELDWDHLRSVK